MKLGVNGWRLSKQRTGVGRYLLNIVRHWDEGLLGSGFSSVRFYSPSHLDPEEMRFPSTVRQVVLKSRLSMIPWENFRLAPVSDEEVHLHPSYSIPLIRRGKTVVVTHDAAHELFPHMFPPEVGRYYKHLYRWSARNATKIIADSEASRQDVSRTMNIPLCKIVAVPLAPEELFRCRPPEEETHALLNSLGIDGAPFFLFVGKLSGRRSVPLLIESFAEFKRKTDLPHKLVVVGLNIHNLDVKQILVDQGVEDEVVYPGFVDDGKLNVLYHSATGFISPSVYETVSLPVMEAQAAGLPVICTGSIGMREITGGHAMLLNEPTVPEMSRAIIEIAVNREARRSIAGEAEQFSRQFTWRRSAKETLDVLLEAANMQP